VQCKTDKETIEYVLFCCTIHDECRAKLKDVVDNIRMSVSARNFVHSKTHTLIAPKSSDFVTKSENSTFKEVFVSIFIHH